MRPPLPRCGEPPHLPIAEAPARPVENLHSSQLGACLVICGDSPQRTVENLHTLYRIVARSPVEILYTDPVLCWGESPQPADKVPTGLYRGREPWPFSRC